MAGKTETRSEVCVPIVASGRVLAVLNLSRSRSARSGQAWPCSKQPPDVLASAIENARLYQRAQEAAVLEERSRLARDLHDSVSQQLFSMTFDRPSRARPDREKPGSHGSAAGAAARNRRRRAGRDARADLPAAPAGVERAGSDRRAPAARRRAWPPRGADGTTGGKRRRALRPRR